MSEWLRRAGSGQQPDGSVVTWSLAEGERGRRWRWTVTDEGRVRHSGLVEIDPADRFRRLELASSAGMLTLHPEADGRSIHGNVVATDGVRPLAFDWSPTAAVAIAGDPFGSTIVQAGDAMATLVIQPRLGVVAGDGPQTLERDSRGVPVLSGSVREWPLEA
jgi:hypothetical protein